MAMALRRRRYADEPGVAERAGWGIARIIRLIATALALLLVAGIALVVFEANRSNEIVNWVLDAAKWLAGPFDGMFSPDNPKTAIAVNWGIAAVVSLIIGSVTASLLSSWAAGGSPPIEGDRRPRATRRSLRPANSYELWQR
jgi:hypothetical protein